MAEEKNVEMADANKNQGEEGPDLRGLTATNWMEKMVFTLYTKYAEEVPTLQKDWTSINDIRDISLKAPEYKMLELWLDPTDDNVKTLNTGAKIALIIQSVKDLEKHYEEVVTIKGKAP